MDLKPILSALACSAICFVPMFATAGSLSQNDARFMKFAAVSEMKEAHLARLAEDNASKSGVKDYGQKVVQDQTNLYGELSSLAAKTGESVPKGIDVRHDKILFPMEHMKGSSFDHRYLAHEVRFHQTLEAACKREAEHGQDPGVKAYAQKLASLEDQHFQQVEQLNKAGK